MHYFLHIIDSNSSDELTPFLLFDYQYRVAIESISWHKFTNILNKFI